MNLNLITIVFTGKTCVFRAKPVIFWANTVGLETKKWYIGAKTVICVGKYSESRGKYSGIFEKYGGKGNHTITDLGYGEIDIISPSTLIFASING